MRTGVLRTSAGAESGKSVICTVIEISMPRDLAGLLSYEILAIPAAGI